MTWKPIPGQSEKSKTCLEINEKINDFISKVTEHSNMQS